MPALQVLNSEIWSHSYEVNVQNVITDSEGRKRPRGSLTILEYAQTRTVEYKIVSML